jgi:chromosome segregation ATPase
VLIPTTDRDPFSVDPVLAKSVVNEVQRIAAETTAPSDAESPPDGYEFARMDAERGRLRAELAAEKKRAMELSTSVEDLIEQRQFDAEAHADTRAQLDKVRHDCDEMIRTFDEVEAQRDDEESAHAATKAQLAQAAQSIMDLQHELAESEKEGEHALRQLDKALTERDAAIAREQAAQAEASALREVIEEQLWRADHALEAFEEQAETFYRETGILAPGKSEPLEWGDRWTDDERRTAWTEWRIKRNAEQVELWRAVIKGTAGRALAARVPLWLELEKWCLQMQGHAKSPHLDHVLAKLAALDEKGTP